MFYILNEQVKDVCIITSDNCCAEVGEALDLVKEKQLDKAYLDLLNINGYSADNRFLEIQYDKENDDTCVILIKDLDLKKKISEKTYEHHRKHNFLNLKNSFMSSREINDYIKCNSVEYIPFGAY